MRWESMDCIQAAQGKVEGRTVLNAVMNFGVQI
jgi:hypothetical protein